MACQYDIISFVIIDYFLRQFPRIDRFPLPVGFNLPVKREKLPDVNLQSPIVHTIRVCIELIPKHIHWFTKWQMNFARLGKEFPRKCQYAADGQDLFTREKLFLSCGLEMAIDQRLCFKGAVIAYDQRNYDDLLIAPVLVDRTLSREEGIEQAIF